MGFVISGLSYTIFEIFSGILIFDGKFLKQIPLNWCILKSFLHFLIKKNFLTQKKNWINFYFMSPDLCHSYLTKIKFNPFQFTCNFFFFKFLLWKTRNILITKNKIVYWIKEYIYFFASWENVRHLQNQKKKLYIEAKTIYS